MEELLDVMFLGRGGQGAKTAAFIYGKSVAYAGFYVKAFPEYGPERTGAPVKAFVRISNKPVRLHCNVYNPDVFVLLDFSLFPIAQILNIEKAPIVLINANEDEVLQIRNQIRGRLFFVDATKISLEEIGKNFPNVPLIGALETILNKSSFDLLEKSLLEVSGAKWTKDLIEKNANALRRGMREIKEL